MSWLQSICPRCRGVMFVPATLTGHSIVCDKCALTYVLYPQEQAPPPGYPAPPPPSAMTLPMPAAMPPPMPLPQLSTLPLSTLPLSTLPQHLSLAPLPPPNPPQQQPLPPQQNRPPLPPSHLTPAPLPPTPLPPAPPQAPRSPLPSAHATPGGYPPSYEPSMLSFPRLPDEAKSPPLPRGGGERELVPMSSPFGSPLPEIEILPPPKAPRPSSRKRSSSSKRSRKHSTSELPLGAAAPPPLPPMIPGQAPVRPPERSRRKKRRGIGPANFISPDADRAAHEVLSAVELRMRRAQMRKVITLSLEIFGLSAMILVAYLVLRWQRPATIDTPAPEPAPVVAPLTDEPAGDVPPSAVQPSPASSDGSQPSDLPKS